MTPFEIWVKKEVDLMRAWKTKKDAYTVNAFADSKLVAFAKDAMLEKLTKAREKGRHGWWDPEVCTVEDLKVALFDQFYGEFDMVDIMNFAAMIYVREIADREETKTPPKPAAPPTERG